MGSAARWLFALLALVEVSRLQAQQVDCAQWVVYSDDAGSDRCSVSSDCDELTCWFDDLDPSSNATVAVEKCTDPLEINVTIDDGEDSFSNKFTSSGSVTNQGVTTSLTTSRNATYVDVQVIYNGTVAVPRVSFLLNQSDCMCDSMDDLISNVHSPVPTTCAKNPACTGFDCFIYIDHNNTVILETEFEFCQEPQAIFVVLRSDTGVPIFDYHFTGWSVANVTIPPNLDIILSVSVAPGNYSMTIAAQIAVGPFSYQMIPEQQVMVDTGLCVTEPPPLTDAPPSNQPITNETCDALTDIATSPFLAKLDVTCHVTATCDGMFCDVVGYLLYVQVLPCEQPPSFFLQVNDSYGAVYENILGVGSTSVSLGDIGTLVFTVTPKPGAVALEVSLITELFAGQPIIIVRETDIPIDQCQCSLPCVPEEVTTLAPPTPGVVSSETCSAIKDLVQGSNLCRLSLGSCDAFVCNTYIGYQVFVQILPCLDSPAFRVMVNDTINSNGAEFTIFDDILTNYTSVPLPDQGEFLHILITSGDEYMTIMVALNYSVPIAIPTIVVPLTQIPFNNCTCPGVVCPSLSSSPSNTPQPSIVSLSLSHSLSFPPLVSPVPTGSASTSSNLIIAIVIPVSVILVIAILVGVVMVVWVIHNRRKRTGGHAFQRMTFVSAEDKDGQESDDDDG